MVFGFETCIFESTSVLIQHVMRSRLLRWYSGEYEVLVGNEGSASIQRQRDGSCQVSRLNQKFENPCKCKMK